MSNVPLGGRFKAAKGTLRSPLIDNDGNHRQWTMILLGIMDFLNQQILKGQLVGNSRS